MVEEKERREEIALKKVEFLLPLQLEFREF